MRIREPKSRNSAEVDAALIRHANDLKHAVAEGYSRAIFVSEPKDVGSDAELVRFDQVAILPTQFDYLQDGDIISIHTSSRRLRTLYRRASKHNSMLVTERCNHYCLMCSQPPRNVDDSWIFDEIRSVLPLIDKSTSSIGFTGGEPLLESLELVDILARCRDVLPNTAIHVLSNGRAFANTGVVNAWSAVKHPDLMVGIPIYSAVDHVHDYVVQAAGAFDETVLGILKLKDQRQRVEVRVVLHAITAPRIVETCRWLARNLPFVDHVALMGLENTGFAIANDSDLWIDPNGLPRVVGGRCPKFSHRRACGVSIYNLPLCVLSKSVWPFAMQSISDWKNDYLKECETCAAKSHCSGFFPTGRPRYSRGIRRIDTPIQSRNEA